MDGASPAGRIVRFGPYEIDREARELRRAGRRVPLQIQPFAVLAFLVERAGQVVTREELRARVWPSTVYVDFNHGLNNALTRLRQALEDSADSPRFIETLPRVGYRFIHPLEPAGSPPAVASAAAANDAHRRLKQAALPLALALAVGILGVGLARWSPPRSDTSTATAAQAVQSAHAEAQVAYLRGRELFEQRRKESIELSIRQLTRATELDPDFAPAYAALAMAHTAAGGNSLMKYRSAGEVLATALAAAQRAVQLDPDLADAHVALAGVLNQLQPWSAANDVVIEHEYQRALELDGSNADALLFYGNFLATRGRGEEALARFRAAVEAKPLSPNINSRLGMELIAQGQPDQGLEYLRRTVELDPWQYNARVRLGWGYVALGDLDAAAREFETAEQISPDSLRSQGGLAFIAARRGDAVEARTRLEAVQPLAEATDTPFEIAIVYVALDDRDLAFEWLIRIARQTRMLHMAGPWGIGAPVYDRLRSDPRFAQIEREVAATTRGQPPLDEPRLARSVARPGSN